jgi:hypothetical protein
LLLLAPCCLLLQLPLQAPCRLVLQVKLSYCCCQSLLLLGR